MNSQTKITFTKEDFNKIVELAHLCLEVDDEYTKKSAKRFIDKVMTYSYIKDNDITMKLYPVDTRFLIELLNGFTQELDISNDWTKDLIAKKEEYKKSKEESRNA